MPGDLAGRSLAQFRVVGKLGEGGMGVVYKAIDERLRRTVALKVLPDSVAHNADRRERFLREARAAAAVTHANIATVHEVGEADGHVFIALELVEGETLRARIDAGLSISESLRIAQEIARGLGRAHDKGIVHRDLKPENVMITPYGEVKILDFGLAKVLEQDPAALGSAPTEVNLTREGHVLGTPAYMSPEQARGEHVDARSDVFSFGVMLFEMLTGERPFGGASAFAVMLAASRDAPKPASQVNPRVAAVMDHVLDRCLAKARDERYASGQELLRALGEVSLAPSTLRVAPSVFTPSPTASLPMPVTPTTSAAVSRRGRWWAWSLVALACLAAAGLALGLRGGAAAQAEAAREGASASGAASSRVLSPSPTTLIDLPPPPSNVPEARSEYAAGMQALRDNSWEPAKQHFERAASLDPTQALIHLRVAMVDFLFDPVRRREEFARATALRGQLSPRDLVLLEALEPLLQRVQPERQEALARLDRASQDHPLDAEFLDWIGLLRSGDPVRALPAAERAIELDPRDGQAWQNQGDSLALLGRTAEARAALERCIAVAVDSVDCLGDLTSLDAIDGRCDAYEADARRYFDRHPYGGDGVATAMIVKGRPDAAALAVFDQVSAIERDAPARAVSEASSRALLAMWSGDLSRAAEIRRQNLRAVSTNPSTKASPAARLDAVRPLVEVLTEMGRDDEARAVARDLRARGEVGASTSVSHGLDLSLYVSRLAMGPGGVSPAAFEEERAAWIKDLTASATYPGLVWLFGYASTALTEEEAIRALAELPRFAPLTSFFERGTPRPDAWAGRTFLLAGRAAEAIPHLARAVANCDAVISLGVRMRAALDLGQAREVTGDLPGACAAYGVVLDRWGKARPRSVTADKAKARAKALSCPR